jgi:prepilin-type N-terminal cleavage/methylation domain-containing protein/prepilin-type processing-associated H-X9-DG protein
MTAMKRKGFTLIELLVVIAIIALLLAIVVPALKRAKAAARFLVCKSNLRSLTTAINSYTVENKGAFIPYEGSTGTSGNRSLWIDAVTNYASNVGEVRLCPEAKTTDPESILATDTGNYQGAAFRAWSWYTPTAESPYAGNNNHSTGSYTFNGYLFTTVGISERDKDDLKKYVDLNYLFNTVSSTSQPATIPVLVDGIWPDAWPKQGEDPVSIGQGTWATGVNPPPPYGTGPGAAGIQNYISRMLIDRHNKRLGVAFLDGHADQTEIVKDLELWSLRWRKGWMAPTTAQVASITAILDARRPE